MINIPDFKPIHLPQKFRNTIRKEIKSIWDIEMCYLKYNLKDFSNYQI